MQRAGRAGRVKNGQYILCSDFDIKASFQLMIAASGRGFLAINFECSFRGTSSGVEVTAYNNLTNQPVDFLSNVVIGIAADGLYYLYLQTTAGSGTINEFMCRRTTTGRDNSTGVVKLTTPFIEAPVTIIDVAPLPPTTAAEGFLQPAHGFAIGDTVWLDSGVGWVLANSTLTTTTKMAHVSSVQDADNFQLQFNGVLGWAGHGFTVGETYFLTNAGGFITPQPTTGIVQATFIPLDVNRVLILEQAVLDLT